MKWRLTLLVCWFGGTVLATAAEVPTRKDSIPENAGYPMPLATAMGGISINF